MAEAKRVPQTIHVTPHATSSSITLPSAESFGDCPKLHVLIDLDKTTNTGNSRTRWGMEVCGDFMLEGWVEVAWIIKDSDGCPKFHCLERLE